MKSVPDSITTLKSSTGTTPEQARDARARAWAYVFSCWQAKQQDMSLQSPRDHPNDSTAKEVNHVEHSSDETSNIVHYPFTKENE